MPGIKAAFRTSVPLVCLLILAMLCAVPTVASGQPWADAYRAGDYEKAADLLHPIVTDPDSLSTSDPEPSKHLALMYARGLGVAPDPIAACTLAQAAGVAAEMAAPRYSADPLAYTASIKEAERFTREHCDHLSNEDRLTAGQSMGCYAFGMTEGVLMAGRHAVRIGRRGIGLADTSDDSLMPLNCPVLVARVRATSIQPPDDAAPGVKARDFIEVFSWYRARDARNGDTTYALQWMAYELRDGKIEGVAVVDHVHVATTWPRRELPPEIDARLTLQMIRSGHVRWRLDGAPPKRGWIMLPEEKPR